mgnify:CR=1 FL=1
MVNNVLAANISLLYNTNLTTIKCDACELSITVIEKYLQSNHTVTELEQVIDNLCNKTPYSQECSVIVDKYLLLIINLLEQEEPPSEICNQIHFCNSSKEYN